MRGPDRPHDPARRVFHGPSISRPDPWNGEQFCDSGRCGRGRERYRVGRLGECGRLLRRDRGHRLSSRFLGFWRNRIQQWNASYRGRDFGASRLRHRDHCPQRPDAGHFRIELEWHNAHAGRLFHWGVDAQGNSNALWVFLESSSLNTASGSVVTVINDGSGAGVGVYWLTTASASLGGTSGPSIFYGNILASTSITVGTGVTDPCGSLMTTTASVTLAGDDTITAGCQGGGALNGTTITPFASSIPEPGTFFLLAPGLAGLAILGRRSRSR